MKIAEAYVELRLDSKKAETEGRAEVNRMGKSLGSQFGEIFAAAAFVGGIAKSVDAASDLNETVSKTKVIFGDSGAEVTKWADNSAKQFGLSKTAALDAASTFATFGKGAGLAGSDLTGFSEKLVGLSSDLASFHNTSPEQAIEAIGAALRGESEPIRQYGVLLDDATLKQRAMEMGLYSGKGALDQHAKVLAAQAEILAQTSDAQGDFARTADGAANSQRIAKAEAENAAASLGQSFLPVYKTAVQVVGALAAGFGELPKPIQLGVVGLAGFLALAGPIQKMIGTAKDLGESIKTMVTGAGALGPIAGGVAIIGAAFVTAFAMQETHQDRVTKATKNYTDAILAANAGSKDAIALQIQADITQGKFLDTAGKLGLTVTDIANVIMGKSVPAYDAVKSKLDELMNPAFSTDIQVKKLTETFGIGVGEASAFQERLSVLTGALEAGKTAAATASVITDKLTESTAGAAGATTDLGDKWSNQIQPGEDLAGVTKKVTDEQDKLAEKTIDVTDKQQNQTKAGDDLGDVYTKLREEGVDRLIESLDKEVTVYDELAAAASDLKKALDAVFGSAQSMEEADRAAQAAKDQLTQAVKDNGVTLDINTDKGRANREQIETNVKSILDYGVAVVGAGGSLDQAADSVAFMTQGLKDQLTQAGFTKEEIDAYLTTLGLTPENVKTSIELAGNEAAKQELKDRQSQLDGLDAGATAEIQSLVDAGEYQKAVDLLDELTKPRTVQVTTIDVVGKVGGKGYASGTTNATPGVHPVAEDGPELVRNRRGSLALFTGGEQVYDAQDTRSMLEAITSRSDAGGMTTAAGGGVTYQAVVNNNGRDVTIDDINRALAIARMR